jgi:hypothetical protein
MRGKRRKARADSLDIDHRTMLEQAPTRFLVPDSLVSRQALSAAFTLAYAVFIIIRTIISGNDVPGYASLLVAILFFGSVQLMSIGLLGEYIGRIYLETKQRPTYLIRKIHGRADGG